jgi:hypothetical protein
LRRDRIGGLGRRGHRHQVDLVFDDRLLGDFGGTIGIGLAVADDDLDRIGLAADLQAASQDGLHVVEDVGIRFGESGERPGLRTHTADLERARDAGGRRVKRSADCERTSCHPALNEFPPADCAH